MTDDRFVSPSAADEEAVSAYLAGELDDEQTAAFEQRLGREPELVSQVEALADALMALGGVAAVELPDGFEQRLSGRLAAERQATPTDLATYRQRRERSRVWLGIGTAAAVVAVAALTAGPMLRTVGQGGGATSAESAGGLSEAAAGGDFSADADSGPGAPVILDRNVAIADEEALQRRYEGLPEAEGLLGTPVAEANELAVRFSKAVSERKQVQANSAPLTAGGGAGSGSAASVPADAAEAGKSDDTGDDDVAEAPDSKPESAASDQQEGVAARDRRAAAAAMDPCLATISQSTDAALVPVRVETVRYDGRRALAYVFVTASPDSETLDRTEVWVVRPRDCATFVFQQY